VKLLAKVVLSLLVLTLVPVAIADARPNRGVWKGSETSGLDHNGNWIRLNDSQSLRVKFRVKRRSRVSNFSTPRFDYECSAAGTTHSVPTKVRRLKRHRRGRFSGKRRTTVAGRTLVISVNGQFTSPRRAKGRLKVALSGCANSYTTKWKAKGPKRRRRPSGGGGGGGGRGGVYCPPGVENLYGDGPSTYRPGYYSPGGYCY
jgi:hypothetical protein